MQQQRNEFELKSIISMLGSFFEEGTMALYVIIAGRLLGADTYGDFLYIFSAFGFITVFTKLGLENGIIAFVSRVDIKIERKRNIIVQAVILTIAVSTVCALGVRLFSPFVSEHLLHDKKYEAALNAMFVIIIAETVSRIFFSILKAIRRTFEYVICKNVLIPVSRVLGLLICVGLQINTIDALVIPLYVGYGLSMLMTLWVLKKEGLLEASEKSLEIVELCKFSLPLLFSGVVYVINHNTDMYMLGLIVGASSVAIYGTAINVGNFSSIALNAINVIFAPLISRYYSKNEIDSIKKLYVQCTKWITIINVWLLGIVLLNPGNIMRIAGDEYFVGGAALIIIMCGQFINSALGPVGYMNIMMNRPTVDAAASLVATAVNIITNALLIPKYGMVGAAIATAFSLALKNIINYIYIYSSLHLFPYSKEYIAIVLGFIISFLTGHSLQKYIIVNHFFLRIVVDSIIYSVLYLPCVFIGSLKEERGMIKEVILKFAIKFKKR